MKFNNFYLFAGIMKAVFVVMALFLIIVGWCIKTYAYTFEMDYSGPGSEFERSMDMYRDHENRESSERCGRDQERSGDREKAEQYEKDHGV